MKKFRLLFKLLWNLPQILIFNFHYLPFKQAIKLPVWLFNVKFNVLKGKVVIKSDDIYPGMIRMGHMAIGPYWSTKGCFVWENNQGGVVEFCSTCSIGSHSAITVGREGKLVFGDNFAVHVSIKIICYNNIIFGKNVLIGWEVFIMDTAFHSIVDKETGEDVGEVSSPIIIGDNCWIGSKVNILKGSRLPNYCVVGAGSLLSKDYGFPEYCIVAGNPPKVIKTGVYRDLER